LRVQKECNMKKLILVALLVIASSVFAQQRKIVWYTYDLPNWTKNSRRTSEWIEYKNIPKEAFKILSSGHNEVWCYVAQNTVVMYQFHENNYYSHVIRRSNTKANPLHDPNMVTPLRDTNTLKILKE